MLECEVGGYLVRAQRTDAWDAIVALLVTLDSRASPLLSRGDAGMPPPVRLQAGDRRPRRPADGTPAAPPRRRHRTRAPAFTARLRDTGRRPRLPSDGAAAATHDASARAAARQRRSRSPSPRPTFARPKKKRTPEARLPVPLKGARPRRDSLSARGDADIRTSIDAVLELLVEAGVMPEPPRALLGAADGDSRAAKTPALEAADGVRAAQRRHRVHHAQSRACVPCEYAACGILRAVAAVHAAGSVRCGGVHLQPGSRMLARARAGRRPRWAHRRRENSTRPCLPTRSSWITTS